jgi:mannose-6-phosphate isomerase-like protein (cupin superfamily)
MRIPIAVIALLSAHSAGAAEIWSASELKGSAAKLAPEADAKGIAGATLGAATLWRRAKSGQAEFHKTKTDLLVIEEGSATLIVGGTIPDAKVTAPNELRGSAIRGGESRRVAPGDIVRIPAGTPHQFVLDKGQSVAYFALKLAR